MEVSEQPTTPSRTQPDYNPPLPPAAYPIAFTQPLNTVCAHPSNARSILVSDSTGTLSVLNWMDLSDPSSLATSQTDNPNQEESSTQIWRGHRIVEFVDPSAVGRSASGNDNGRWGGGASWKPNDPDTFGATYGGKWFTWNLKNLQGGKPTLSGEGFAEGGHRFRCDLTLK